MLKIARRAGWRIVIVDPKKGWMGRGTEKKEFAENGSIGTVDNPVHVTAFDPTAGVQIFQPFEWDEQCDEFFTAVMAWGNTIVYVDEITQLAQASRVPRVFKVLLTQGRANNVACWCGTQRPRGIPLDCKEQAEIWFVFHVKSKDDREVVEGYIPVEETPQLVEKAIPVRWFWYYDDRMSKPVLVKPLVIKKKEVKPVEHNA